MSYHRVQQDATTDDDHETKGPPASRASVPLIISMHLLVLNVVLSIALAGLVWRALEASPSRKSKLAPGELLYTLGQDVIANRVERAYVGPGNGPEFVESAYQGWPTDDKDELWKKYEDGNHVRISADEAAQLPRATEHVPLAAHADEFLVGLVVAHQLHCLSALRRAVYPRRYNSSLVRADGRVDYARWHHVDHCIEVLRASLECRPDTTPMTFAWVPGSTLAVHPATSHTCRDWGAVSGWVAERAVEVPVRAHVEGEHGAVVDYTGREWGREYNETWPLVQPDGWEYTREDM